MKIIWKGNDFTLFLYKKYEESNIKKNLKEILIKIRKKYYKKISGFYNVTIYPNDLIGMIIDFKKEDNFDFFSDITDLDINISKDKNIYLEFDNPCLINKDQKVYFYKEKYYLDLNKLKKEEYYKFLEFSKIRYGKEISNIIANMKELKV